MCSRARDGCRFSWRTHAGIAKQDFLVHEAGVRPKVENNVLGGCDTVDQLIPRAHEGPALKLWHALQIDKSHPIHPRREDKVKKVR